MKTNVNKVELVGFAGMDAEVREIRKGMRVARFSLATRENYKNSEGEWVSNTIWHRIVLWNANADIAAEAVKKGSKVSVTGRINQKSYETVKGEKRFVVEILAKNLTIVA
ncbi:MAG: single-stranded DNA-binding protein [Bacteroidales bacterium]|nr:single-stranded DNA-binding protein [Bacteroidales bacterium]